MFDRWINVCGNRHLEQEISAEQIYNSYRVCSLHFLPEDFGNYNQLKKGVVPSLK